jgi:hypothetical protein
MENRVFKEGDGWRIGFNPNPATYQGLIAGENWAIELTLAEWQDFCRLVSQLRETMQAIAIELMDEEKVTCEAESDLIWLEATGYPHFYSLRFILNQGRCCEGQWPPGAVPNLIQSLQTVSGIYSLKNDQL